MLYNCLILKKRKKPQTTLQKKTLELPWIMGCSFVYRAKNRYYHETDKIDFLPELDINYSEYPDRISNMPTTLIDQILDPKYVGKRAVGILVNGHIYRDDTPFWLGLVKSRKMYHVVYERQGLMDWLTWISRTVWQDCFPEAPKLPDYELEWTPTSEETKQNVRPVWDVSEEDFPEA